MGGDGGSLNNCRDLIKLRKKPGMPDDPAIEAAARYSQDVMTNDVLRPPIVACELGFLFNKLSALSHIQAMKHKEKDGTAAVFEFSHITSLRHIIECKVKYDDADEARLKDPMEVVFFICPLTGVPANGKRRFVVMTKCGCVLSEKALHEVSGAECVACPVCSKKLARPISFAPAPTLPSPSDEKAPSSSSSAKEKSEEELLTDPEYVVLCPPPDEQATMRFQLMDRRAAQEKKKKEARKAKKDEAKASSSSSSADDAKEKERKKRQRAAERERKRAETRELLKKQKYEPQITILKPEVRAAIPTISDIKQKYAATVFDSLFVKAEDQKHARPNFATTKATVREAQHR